MVSVHSHAVAALSRAYYDPLYAAFTAAAMPHMVARIREFPVSSVKEKSWGFVVAGMVAAIYAIEAFVEKRTRLAAGSGLSFEDNMSAEYARNLTAAWLRGLRTSDKPEGDIQAGAVLPGDPAFAAQWKEIQDSVVHFGPIDAGAVLRTGLQELARNPGDLILPHGMIIKRPVLDAALARGPQV